ncbi:MAG: glycerol-3-phosphate dehydrogenase/oxidase [Bradymonadia bacterium]
MTLRATQLAALRATAPFDVLVLGAGINGAVSAAALAGRGARVALVDAGDFAGVTSQSSSNLAWGGIKYLETLEFGLVRKLCRSRNALMRAYPSTVREIRFFANLDRGFRWPAVSLYAASLLYWVMGNCFTRRPRYLTPSRIARDEPIVDVARSIGGLEYSDAYLHDNDARFVFGFVRAALDHGAVAANYVRSLGARHDPDGLWTVELTDTSPGADPTPFHVRTRVLVNACGPWVDAHNTHTGTTTAHRHVFSKGIHLIVERVSPNPRVLTFFADDGRMFFAIPMGRRTVVGTTDNRVDSPETHVTPEDRRFVLENINKRLRLPRPLTEADIIAERCGVRPLAVRVDRARDSGRADWTKLSRKHAVDVDRPRRHLSIYGGKLTDCLNVGDEVCAEIERLGVAMPRQARWYGEPDATERRAFFDRAAAMGLDAYTPTHASEPLSERFWRRYGARARPLLDRIEADRGGAEVVIDAAEYLRVEVEEAAHSEMVVRLEDFLRRRSKISLVMRHDTLAASPGVFEACRVLFGEGAEEAWSAYFERPCPWGRSAADTDPGQ